MTGGHGSLSVPCQTGDGTCESKCECFVIKTEVIIGLFFRFSRFLRIVSLSSSLRLFCALMCSKWRCVRYPSPHCIGLHKPVAVRFGTHPSTLQAPLSTTLTLPLPPPSNSAPRPRVSYEVKQVKERRLRRRPAAPRLCNWTLAARARLANQHL